ncbi:hypothetical protein CRI94_01675 [Longibacter salinarum]|uniref:Uncharacterized protein n=1 Tax=Longibacter salinarum TaxID=1850348 RepID=A0A2A8D3D3_9BACT|nr:hypothetical protein CRI94_01675 [Longibacter salinarum]
MLPVDTVTTHRDTLAAGVTQPFDIRPFVMAGSVMVERNGEALSPKAIQLEAVPGRLWVRPFRRLERTDTLVVTYRTLPLNLRPVYRRRTLDSTATADSSADSLFSPFRSASADSTISRSGTSRGAEADTIADAGYVVVEESGRDSLPQFDPFAGVDLQRTGSISRGVTGGTNQDAGIDSGLRLQLEGNLTDDVAVRALLTDQNTPIQPDGTTQRLDDFDRVFIELETPQAILQLGDVEVQYSETQFAGFNRKIQGATLQSATWGPTLGINEGRGHVLGAVSRGQYRTQDIDAIDGVQGPYRLEGANGERFVVVVAGSERVYLDGQRLERGRTNDYIIDYTRSEITFTSNRIITDDRRITVEFQYRTSQFDRTLVGGQSSAGFWADDKGRSRVSVGATYLREADGRDFSSAFNLTPADSIALADAGDSTAVRSGARRVEFDPEAPFIYYQREVRSTPNGTDTVFVAIDEAPEEGTDVFRVNFTRVGSGNGSYTRVGRQQNGILYEYSGPGQGEYSPVQPIPRPQMKQLVDFTASIQPVGGVRLFGEWAQSLNDRNRFSPKDEANDRGQAYVTGLRLQSTTVDIGSVDLGTISASMQRRVRESSFETFDQTRAIEFNRDWNLSRSGSTPAEALLQAGDEMLDRAEASWQITEASDVSGSAGRLQFGDAFDARRVEGQVSIQEAGWPRLRVSGHRVASTDRIEGTEGTWTKQQHVIRQPIGVFEPSLRFDREVRDQQFTASGRPTDGAFAYTEWEPGLTVDAGKLTFAGRIAYRLEDETLLLKTIRAARATTGTASAQWTPDAPYDLAVQGGYRVRRFTEPFERVGERDTESLLMKVDIGTQPWRRAVDARLFYDAKTEREPTLQEVYVRTGVDLGQFVWQDANGDGLQQVDEFVPETTPNEGAYVQSFVPSDSLASVVSIDSRLRLRLEPRQIWKSSDERWKRWLTRVESRSLVELQETSRSNRLVDLYVLNPDVLRRPGSTIDGTLRLQQELDLFPQSQTAGLDLAWTQARGLTERAAGQERSFLNAWEAATRWRIASSWTARLSSSVQTDRSLSEAFTSSRSYDIDAWQLRPEVSFRPTETWQVTSAAAVGQKEDAVKNRSARVVRFPVEVAWARAGRFRVKVNGELSDIRLDGDAVGLAQFELTDGRGAGRSYLWGARGQYQVSGNIEASFAYDGRAPADAETIHTFRVNLTAQF